MNERKTLDSILNNMIACRVEELEISKHLNKLNENNTLQKKYTVVCPIQAPENYVESEESLKNNKEMIDLLKKPHVIINLKDDK